MSIIDEKERKRKKHTRPNYHRAGTINWGEEIGEVVSGLCFTIPSNLWEGARRYISSRGYVVKKKDGDDGLCRVMIMGKK